VRGLVDVFVSPGALFERLAVKPHWILPFVALAIVIMGQQILLHPYSARAILGMINDQMAPQMQQALRDSATKPIGPLALLSQPIVLLIGLLLGAGVLTGLAAMFTGKTNFKAFLGAMAYAKLITIPAIILSLMIVMLRGIDSVQSMMDLIWTIGPAMFVSDNKLLFNILSQINLFEIWYLVVLVIAVRKITGTTGAGATAAALVYWLLGAVLQVLMFALTMNLR
jgi:hypothetical protein